MTVNIHPTAVVAAGAELGDGTTVGPHSVIEDGAVVGDDNELGAGCHLYGSVRMGARNRLMHGAILGGEPQDLQYKREPTLLIVGDDNWIGEFATIHRGTPATGKTEVGNHNFIMSTCHVGHDCRVGDDTVVSSGVILGGGTRLYDRVTLGGNAGVHQNCRLGELVMVGGLIRISQDVLPFTLVGEDNRLTGLNRVGLRRAGYSQESIARLKEAYRRFCIRREPLKTMVAWLEKQNGDPLLDRWREFLSVESHRGYTRDRPRGGSKPDGRGS